MNNTNKSSSSTQEYRLVGMIHIYPEICCEDCNEVEHNHLDCPACGIKRAPSDRYSDLLNDDAPIKIGCEKCGAQFQLIQGSIFDDGVWAWINPPNTKHN